MLTWDGCSDKDESYRLFVQKLRNEIRPETEELIGDEQFDRKADDADGGTSEDRSGEFDRELTRGRQWGDQLGLFTAGDAYDNWGGLHEKWLQGTGGSWYYITPGGEFFRWNGRSNLLGMAGRFFQRKILGNMSLDGTLLARFGRSPTATSRNGFHDEPQRLTARVLGSVSAGPELLTAMSSPEGPLWPAGDVPDEQRGQLARRQALDRLRGTYFGPEPYEHFQWTAADLPHVLSESVQAQLPKAWQTTVDAYIEKLVRTRYDGERSELLATSLVSKEQHWNALFATLGMEPPGLQTCVLVTLSPAGQAGLDRVLGRGLLGRPAGKLVNLAVESGVGAPAPPSLLPRVSQPADSGRVLRMGGPPVENVAFDEEASITLVQLACGLAVLGFVLGYACFQRVTVAVMILIVGAISALCSLAAVGWPGSRVDVFLVGVPAFDLRTRHGRSDFRGACVPGNRRAAWRGRGTVACDCASRLAVHSGRGHDHRRPAVSVGECPDTRAAVRPVCRAGRGRDTGSSVEFPASRAAALAAKIRTPSRRDRAERSAPPDGRPVALDERLGNRQPMAGPRDRGTGRAGRRTRLGQAHNIRAAARPVRPGYEDRARRRLDRVPCGQVPAVGFSGRRRQEVSAGPRRGGLEPTADHTGGDARRNYQYSLLERVELVGHVQHAVEQAFGNQGLDVVGGALSAATLVAPERDPLNTQRGAATALVEGNRERLVSQSYLSTDNHGQELWRISLRVSALDKLDYARFMTQLKRVVEPVLKAYALRDEVLRAVAQQRPDVADPARRWADTKIAVLGASDPWEEVDQVTDVTTLPENVLDGILNPQENARDQDDRSLGVRRVFAQVLADLLRAKGYQGKRSGRLPKQYIAWQDPRKNPLGENAKSEAWAKTLATFDCVVVLQDHSDYDLDFIRQHAKSVIDARQHRFDPARQNREAIGPASPSHLYGPGAGHQSGTAGVVVWPDRQHRLYPRHPCRRDDGAVSPDEVAGG